MRHGHREKGMGREYGHGGHGGPPRGRGGRMRRGDTRYALLSALTDGPGHGYELIQRLEERTGGRWKPSPGSVYPTLQLLADYDEALAEFERRQADELDALAEQWDEYLTDWQEQESA